MREVCALLGIDKMRTTVYKPSTNAACERFHRTLNTTIGKVLDDDQRDWDVVLPYVMAAYRSTRHTTTGHSPNLLTLGREVRAPIDLVLGSSEDDSDRRTYDEFVEDLRRRMLTAYELVREHTGLAAERNKHQYDLRVKPTQYQEGDFVHYFNPRNRQNKQNKWLRKYSRPFEVVRILGPVNVLLRKSSRSKPFVAHLDKLKPFLRAVEEVQMETETSEDLNGRELEEVLDQEEPLRRRRTVRKPARYDD